MRSEPASVHGSELARTHRGLIPEDLAYFRWVEEISISPDGAQVAYTVRRPNAALDGYTSDAYVIRLEGREHRRLTSGQGITTGLAWSRDARRLACVWEAGQQTSLQIWTLPEWSCLEIRVPDAPSQLDWHPDGRRLACVRWVKQIDDDPDAVDPINGAVPTVRVIRRLRYTQDGVGFVHDRYQHVFVLDVSTQEFIQITDGECDYLEPAWSRTGSRLAFVAQAREGDTPLGQGQLFVMTYPGGVPKPLIPGWMGACRSPQWGPDDQTIAFAGHNVPPPVNRRLFPHVWVYDLQTGDACDLSGALDQMVGNYAAAQDQRLGYRPATVRWPEGSPHIYFLVTEHGATHLYRVTTAGALERLVDGPCVVFAYAASSGSRVAFARADPQSPGDVYLLDNGRLDRLTDTNPWLRARRLSPPTEYWYQSAEGQPVHAWVIRPLDAQDGRRYPTIVYVHCSMFSWDFNHEFQCLAAAGYAVAYFNQWGTTAGYGQAWALGSQGDQGGRDYREVMLGVDDLIQQPFVDRDRLGITGWSCGGFLTNWVIGHTDRFKAAVSQVAISNYVNFWGSSDGGPEGTYRETGALPWMDLATVWRQSPLAYVDRIRTPVLIMHTDADHRVGIDQAEQLFAALRWLGRETEFVWFCHESHLLHQGGRPMNRIERIRRILGWFRKHLGDRPVADTPHNPHSGDG